MGMAVLVVLLSRCPHRICFCMDKPSVWDSYVGTCAATMCVNSSPCMQRRQRAKTCLGPPEIVAQARANQLCAMRAQLLCAQPPVSANAGVEQAGICMNLQFGASPAHPEAPLHTVPVNCIHARSFDTWMASHQLPADMQRCGVHALPSRTHV